MRISAWSSDVCSSDLLIDNEQQDDDPSREELFADYLACARPPTPWNFGISHGPGSPLHRATGLADVSHWCRIELAARVDRGAPGTAEEIVKEYGQATEAVDRGRTSGLDAFDDDREREE